LSQRVFPESAAAQRDPDCRLLERGAEALLAFTQIELRAPERGDGAADPFDLIAACGLRGFLPRISDLGEQTDLRSRERESSRDRANGQDEQQHRQRDAAERELNGPRIVQLHPLAHVQLDLVELRIEQLFERAVHRAEALVGQCDLARSER
jgi:hypothetical protein